jgi:4'-phosphopantetheinyl transferase
MVEVYAIHLLPDEDFLKVSGHLLGYLPELARTRFSRYSRVADMQRSLLGEMLARYLLAGRLKINSSDIVFVAGPNGKPSFPEGPEIHFNISHSGQWAVCAIANKSVGVDVERMRRVNPGLAERFFSPDEVATLRGLPSELQAEKFIQLWTLKESFLKAIGRGLTRNLNSFSISDQGAMFSITGDDSAVGYRLKLFDLASDHLLAVCAISADFCENVEIVTVTQILSALGTP